METKTEISHDGTMTVRKIHDDGRESRWDMHASQIGLHLRGVQKSDHPFSGMSRGDISAALDAHDEFRRRR